MLVSERLVDIKGFGRCLWETQGLRITLNSLILFGLRLGFCVGVWVGFWIGCQAGGFHPGLERAIVWQLSVSSSEAPVPTVWTELSKPSFLGLSELSFPGLSGLSIIAMVQYGLGMVTPVVLFCLVSSAD